MYFKKSWLTSIWTIYLWSTLDWHNIFFKISTFFKLIKFNRDSRDVLWLRVCVNAAMTGAVLISHRVGRARTSDWPKNSFIMVVYEDFLIYSQNFLYKAQVVTKSP